MKRGLLGLVCLLLLAVAGCASVNQSNSFVELRPETPAVSAAPAITNPPVVQLSLPPATAPAATQTAAPAPAVSDTPLPAATPAPTQGPEGNPSGFNG